MTGILVDIVIALLPTFIVSRLLLWPTRRWSDSTVRLIAVHTLSFALCVVGVNWLPVADLPHRSIAPFVVFAPGQLAWLLIDAFRLVRRRRERGE